MMRAIRKVKSLFKKKEYDRDEDFQKNLILSTVMKDIDTDEEKKRRMEMGLFRDVIGDDAVLAHTLELSEQALNEKDFAFGWALKNARVRASGTIRASVLDHNMTVLMSELSKAEIARMSVFSFEGQYNTEKKRFLYALSDYMTVGFSSAEGGRLLKALLETKKTYTFTPPEPSQGAKT